MPVPGVQHLAPSETARSWRDSPRRERRPAGGHLPSRGKCPSPPGSVAEIAALYWTRSPIGFLPLAQIGHATAASATHEES